jgi:ubiquinone/menaquinone biosynthesis C-methylase UbiE
MAPLPHDYIRGLAEDYDGKRRMAPEDFDRLIDLILRYGNPKAGVLEIGCGTGTHLVGLAEHLTGVCFCGLDIASEMVRQAAPKLRSVAVGNCHLVQGDGQSLPFKPESFDFLYLSQSLHYFDDKEALVAEVWRVCLPGGRVLVATTSHPQLRCQVDLAFFPGISKADTARIPSLPQVRRLFEDMGFELFSTVEFAATFKATNADALVKHVTRKPWSSYLPLGDGEFRKKLEVFRRRLTRAFGEGEIAYLVPQTLMFFRKA